MLAGWAAIAIANARLYRDVRERRDELERTIRGLETTTEISRALGGVTDLERVLELVVKRSRALLDARVAEIALLEGDEFVIAAVAGEGVSGSRRARAASRARSPARRCSRTRRGASTRSRRTRFAARELGARTAIVTPMLFRSRPVGFLIVLDRSGGRPFTDEDERLLEAFAAGAATAVATAADRRATRRCDAHRGLGGRAPPLGARAARRDAAGPRRPARAALRRAPQRRPERIARRGRRGGRAARLRHRRPARADRRPAPGGARRARRAARRSSR